MVSAILTTTWTLVTRTVYNLQRTSGVTIGIQYSLLDVIEKVWDRACVIHDLQDTGAGHMTMHRDFKGRRVRNVQSWMGNGEWGDILDAQGLMRSCSGLCNVLEYPLMSGYVH